MRTKLFRRLSYLLCLFQISCFVALQHIPLHSSSFSSCSDAHKKIDVACDIHSKELQIEPSNFGSELLVYGFIREFEPKVANKIIPDCIMNLCAGFSRRMLPCDCIKEKYRKILPQLDIDEYRKKALIFFLMYKIQDVQNQKGKSKKTLLHYACGNGYLGLAKLLKERGANINAKDKDGNNALHAACLFSGSEAMITWLLDVCEIDIETEGCAQMPPFLFAAQGGQLEIAKLLKEQEANINAKDKDGNNALHFACLSGSVEMTNWLLDVCKLDIETKGLYERTPFLYAAQKGKLAIAKLLKERGANIYATDKNGDNALHWVCWSSGSEAMITWLLDECKLDIETKGYEQMTPFLCAMVKGKLGIAKLLRQRGANVNAEDKNGFNALHLACLFSGNVEMVTWLLDVCKIDLKTKGWAEKTPFLCAAGKGKLGIAKLLRQRGANIKAEDKRGYNALHFACLFSNSVAMVTWLLDICKIGIETKTNEERTSFLFAAQGGQLEIAKLLKKRGANIHAKNEYGNNALHFACLWSKSVAMVKWLLDECKIDLEAKGYEQNTPFLCAVGGGHLPIAKLLRQRGANLNARDKNRNNALHRACLFSHSIEMVTWLLDMCHIGIEAKGGEYKNTPFICAANKGQLEIAKLLKDRGANIICNR